VLLLAVVMAAIIGLRTVGDSTALVDAALRRVRVVSTIAASAATFDREPVRGGATEPTATPGCGCDLLPQFRDSW
jgi:hypothetical protein